MPHIYNNKMWVFASVSAHTRKYVYTEKQIFNRVQVKNKIA